MPRVSEVRRIDIRSWHGGLNNRAPASMLTPSESAVLENANIDTRGALRMRDGFSKYDTSGLTSVNPIWLSSYWDKLGDPSSTSNARQIIACSAGGTLYFDDGGDGAFTAFTGPVFSPNSRAYGITSARVGNALYISSQEYAGMVKWTGANPATSTSPTGARCLVHHHDRLFYVAPTETNSSRIYFSDIGAPETVQSDSWIDIDPHTNDQITTAIVFGDDLLIFKETSIWKLSGRTPASFALYRVDDQRGTQAPYSVAELNGRVFFFDATSGIWAFDGASFELVSDSFNDDLLNNLHSSHWATNAYATDDKYVIAVMTTGDVGAPSRSFVYHLHSQTWTEHTVGWQYGMTLDDELGNPEFVTPPNLVNGVYERDDAAVTDPNTPTNDSIVMKVRTPWFRVGEPGQLARIRRIEGLVYSGDNSNATVISARLYRNYDESTVYLEKDLTRAAATAEEWQLTNDGWGDKLQAFQFEFETDMHPFEFRSLSIFYTGGLDVRGNRGATAAIP